MAEEKQALEQAIETAKRFQETAKALAKKLREEREKPATT